MAEPLSEYGCHRPSRLAASTCLLLQPGLGVGILGDGDGLLGALGLSQAPVCWGRRPSIPNSEPHSVFLADRRLLKFSV